jgi:hypothetical protein
MSNPRITLLFAKHLQTLVAGGVCRYSDFTGSSRKLLEVFIQDGILDSEFSGTQQKKVVCRSPENLANYLHNKFEIPDLARYVEFLRRTDFQRSDAVKATSDSKFRRTTVLSGFFVNSYEEIQCSLNGFPFVVRPTKGAFSFVYGTDSFRVPEDIAVVVVEGYENFRELHRQRYLFDGSRFLFLWRYQNSNAIAEWLQTIQNDYIHFGDFDLKGIHIYQSEFKRKVGRKNCRFFIPDDIDTLISRHGEKDLFERQKDLLSTVRLNCDEENMLELINVIARMKKGLAQEILIR